MQVSGLPNAFDRRDFVALVHHREREAAVHAPAVHMDGAGAALPVIAAFLGAGQMDPLAQRVEQRGARVEAAQRVVLAIDAEGHSRWFPTSQRGLVGLRGNHRGGRGQRCGAG